jgi:hypothetical protein
MTYFVNLLQTSYGQAGRYYSYRLYSGESVEDIKMNILNGIKDEWGDYIDGFERNLDIISDKPLKDLVTRINDLIQDYMDEDYGDITDYDLILDDPYTDLGKSFDFYSDYLELLEGDIEDYEDASFYFYGDYAIKIQDVFPILSDIRDEYNVSIPTGYAEKMSRYLFGAYN